MVPRLFYSVLYHLAVARPLPDSKFSRRVKRWYADALDGKAKDYPVLTRVNHQWFLCPFSHQLTSYQRDYPLYDRQLARLCCWLHGKLRRKINIIDIGSNVGDTVVNIGLKVAFYRCVEGDENFSKYIHSNLNHRYHYSLERCFLTDNPHEGSYSFTASNGTGRLTTSGENLVTGLSSLDELLRKNHEGMVFDLIKVDTDGFDFKVIRGAQQCLKEQQPLLFFEWDKASCKEQGEEPLSIFPFLEELGYQECILFDNFGHLMEKLDMGNKVLLQSYLDNSIGEGLPYYYDVLAVPGKGVFSADELFSVFKPV